MADELGISGVFSECVVAFVPSSTLAPKHISELAKVVEDNGATICEPRRDGTIAMGKVTHIVSNTIDFGQYVESQAVMIPVVSTQWITASISRRRQAQVRPFSPDPRMIFAEVVVTCGDVPVMDKEGILGATMALGGQESKDVNRLTTHVCSLSMDHPKVQMALKMMDQKGWKGKIVLPHWFDACFKLGKRIDEGPYLLPNPKVFSLGPADELEIPKTPCLEGATSANPQWLPVPPDIKSGRPPVTVFRDRKVFLSSDLGITSRLVKVLADLINNGGGKWVDDVDDCDMFICQYRDGAQYVKAAQSCKEIGSLSWLFYLVVHNQWRNPLHRLLHYPVPRKGIEGFENLRITVSNYGGEARTYLENLIRACGAEYTKTMRPENTHLVTARDTSDKCKAAPEWGVAVINHLWLEESYAKCEKKQINISKYNHFPPCTNLGEIIGQTFLDESCLREMYYPGGEDSMSPRAKRKRKILEAAEDNAYHQGPAEGVVIGRSRQQQSANVSQAESNARSVEMANAKIASVRTPRRPQPGKENSSPSLLSVGSRSAKAKAKDLLQTIAPDIALYEKEKKRHTKAGVPWGGKRAADNAEKQTKAKAAAAKALQEAENEAAATPVRPAKKARPSLPEIELRIAITSYDKWTDDSNQEDRDRLRLRNLGIQVVQHPPCDYVVAPRIVRTVKFLCSLAWGASVLSVDFIDEVLKKGEIPIPEEYALNDQEGESRNNFRIVKSVARAKAHKGKLLQGIPIYCTEKIKGGWESYQSISQANGAIFKVYRARSGTTIKPSTVDEDGDTPPDPVYLLTHNSSEEKQLWPRFKEMAKRGNMEPRVVAGDWLLDVCMAQEVRFSEKFLAETWYASEGGK
ncbi:hypothetical protein CDD82_142 [Ophiocordyceps australis]|uniref:BRCT domain-containing protein n=1 Tax=Ophiocordyceps australis TaxID=1399860 RepID=A0A2C5Y1B7_9HYPO|nr:hypothetical protein CDD82_142 [Ophiocordyceps australis]